MLGGLTLGISLRKVAQCAIPAAALWASTAETRGQRAIQEWVQRYNVPGNGSAYATGIALDASGDVYVTGYSSNSITGYDFATLKYSSAGIALWTNRYAGPGNCDDYPSAIAVAPDGNVYVTGTSSNAVLCDCVTIKYSSAGLPLWTNRYNGPGNGVDKARALTVDANNDAVVTGYGRLNLSSDFLTLKYSSTGVLLWANWYAGPGNFDEYAWAVAVDGGGNVCIAGCSPSSGTYDWVVIKYSSAGVGLWTNYYDSAVPYNYDFPQAIASDASGNVVVSGWGYNGVYRDYITIKYSGSGLPLWTNAYNGPGGRDDVPYGLVLDGSGSVIVTGASAGSGTGFDFGTIKYSASGVPLWTNRYDGPGSASNDYGQAVAVDARGDVYVTGRSGTNGAYDYATVKYSSTGAPLWTNRYTGPGNGDNNSVAVVVDTNGSAYVTGYSWNGSNYDYATIKYSVPTPIRLNLERAGNTLALIWTNAAFHLQCASAVVGPYTNVAGATSPYTNSATDSFRFFRLICE